MSIRAYVIQKVKCDADIVKWPVIRKVNKVCESF